MLVTFGILHDFLVKLKLIPLNVGEKLPPKSQKQFTSLYQSYNSFFTRNMYMRARDCWNNPISSVPGRQVDVMERQSLSRKGWNWAYKLTGKVFKDTLNLASYNYLGFADTTGICADTSENAVNSNSFTSGSNENELGRTTLHNELENLTANFLRVEDAICFGMGFATNSMNIPTLVDSKSLVISDQLNHSSIVTGCKLSGATINVYKHNNMDSLEHVIRKAILYGNPKRMNRPYNKILIIGVAVEAISWALGRWAGL